MKCDYVGEDAEIVQVSHLVVIALRNPHLVRCFGCYASEAVSDDFTLRRAVENQTMDAPSGTLTGQVNPGIVTVLARATFDDPHHYPVGIPHVFVAGQAVVRAGKVTGERPGAILRGPGYRNQQPGVSLSEETGVRA